MPACLVSLPRNPAEAADGPEHQAALPGGDPGGFHRFEEHLIGFVAGEGSKVNLEPGRDP